MDLSREIEQARAWAERRIREIMGPGYSADVIETAPRWHADKLAERLREIVTPLECGGAYATTSVGSSEDDEIHKVLACVHRGRADGWVVPDWFVPIEMPLTEPPEWTWKASD
jgi:hypothetical protein